MRFEETPLPGAYLVHLEKHGDERGFFSRMFCQTEFAGFGLEPKVLQINNSFSADKGTLRGIHYQVAPKQETKLVRVLSGSIYDVIVDIRPESATYMQTFGAHLTAENRTMVYVPRGFGHGFLTLEENTEVLYLTSESYASDLERGIRWDDPAFTFHWPEEPVVVSEKDRSHPDWISVKYN